VKTPRITRYSIGNYDRITGERPIDIEETNAEKGTWAIRQSSLVLGKDLEWEFEPSPSNRDEEFLERCRWRLDEALIAASDAHDRMLQTLKEEALAKLKTALANPPIPRKTEKFQVERESFEDVAGKDLK
jgi:hypothetical protein